TTPSNPPLHCLSVLQLRADVSYNRYRDRPYHFRLSPDPQFFPTHDRRSHRNDRAFPTQTRRLRFRDVCTRKCILKLSPLPDPSIASTPHGSIAQPLTDHH